MTGTQETHKTGCTLKQKKRRSVLKVVNVNFTLVAELERALSVFLSEGVCLVNLDSVRKLPVPNSLELACTKLQNSGTSTNALRFLA